MTLGEFSCLLDVEPKWVQNVVASLGGSLPFTLAAARRLAVARALADALGVPMPRAHALAGSVLRRYKGSRTPVTVNLPEDAAVTVTIDVYRILARVSVGLSRLRTLYAERQRGRPAAPRNPIAAAEDYGVDISLLKSNLRRTHEQRLRQLDAMVDFRRRVRRA